MECKSIESFTQKLIIAFRCLSAMKCLANWPVTTLNGEDSHFPNYRGFEIDVFSVVKDYFLGLRVPLVTYDLFDIFVSAYIKVRLFHKGSK